MANAVSYHDTLCVSLLLTTTTKNQEVSESLGKPTHIFLASLELPH